jgi:hypothetical protein
MVKDNKHSQKLHRIRIRTVIILLINYTTGKKKVPEQNGI